MFEYLLDNPFTISYNDDDVIAQLSGFAFRTFADSKLDYLLVKIFDKSLLAETRTEIINTAIQKRRYQLFESLLSKCPNLGVEFQKNVVVNLIKEGRISIAETLLKRQEMNVINFYDFNSETKKLITSSKSQFLNEYITQADIYKLEVLKRLLNKVYFDEKLLDVLVVDYKILKLNLKESEVNVDENECIICFHCYVDDSKVVVLQCGHYLHQECYENAGKMKKTCSMCMF